MTQKYRKAWKLQWKHIRNKLDIHAKNGFYMRSDIQRYYDYCDVNGFLLRLDGLRIWDDIALEFE